MNLPSPRLQMSSPSGAKPGRRNGSKDEVFDAAIRARFLDA
jgi:hypothetical protein